MLKHVQAQSLPNRVCLYLQLVVARSTVVFSSLIVTPILQFQKLLVNFVIFCWGLLLIVILKYHYLMMLGVAIKFCHFFKGITSLL